MRVYSIYVSYFYSENLTILTSCFWNVTAECVCEWSWQSGCASRGYRTVVQLWWWKLLAGMVSSGADFHWPITLKIDRAAVVGGQRASDHWLLCLCRTEAGEWVPSTGSQVRSGWTAASLHGGHWSSVRQHQGMIMTYSAHVKFT